MGGNAPAVKVATHKAHGAYHATVSSQPHAAPQDVHNPYAGEKYSAAVHAPAHIPVHKPAPYHPAPVYKPAPVYHPAPVYMPQLTMPQLQLIARDQSMKKDQLYTNTDTLSMMIMLTPTSKPTKTVTDMPPTVNTVSTFLMVVPKLSPTT